MDLPLSSPPLGASSPRPTRLRSTPLWCLAHATGSCSSTVGGKSSFVVAWLAHHPWSLPQFYPLPHAIVCPVGTFWSLPWLFPFRPASWWSSPTVGACDLLWPWAPLAPRCNPFLSQWRSFHARGFFFDVGGHSLLVCPYGPPRRSTPSLCAFGQNFPCP